MVCVSLLFLLSMHVYVTYGYAVSACVLLVHSACSYSHSRRSSHVHLLGLNLIFLSTAHSFSPLFRALFFQRSPRIRRARPYGCCSVSLPTSRLRTAG